MQVLPEWYTKAARQICVKAQVGGSAVICPGVTVGEGATIAAGSVVTRDVEALTLVGGNPAKLIKLLQRTAGH